MIDVFVIRRFYGTEGEQTTQHNRMEGNEISRKEKEGKGEGCCTCFHETKGAIIAAEWMAMAWPRVVNKLKQI